MILLALAVAALALPTTLAAASSQAAAPQPSSRIVDRTLLCKTWGAGYPDPLRVLTVLSDPGIAQATNGPQGTPRLVVAQVAMGVNGQDQVVLSRTACRAASTRIPLSPKGLESGATIYGNKWQCPVGATVLIRVRATFQRPVSFRAAVDAPYLSIAQGKILEGSVAIAKKDKSPISYATVHPKNASLFVAKPRCIRVKK